MTVRAPHPPRGFLSLASPPPHRPPCEPCGDCRGLPSGLPPRSSGRGHCCPCLLSRWHHHLPRRRRFSGRASCRRPWPGVGAELRESPREAAPQKQTPPRSPGGPASCYRQRDASHLTHHTCRGPRAAAPAAPSPPQCHPTTSAHTRCTEGLSGRPRAHLAPAPLCLPAPLPGVCTSPAAGADRAGRLGPGNHLEMHMELGSRSCPGPL